MGEKQKNYVGQLIKVELDGFTYAIGNTRIVSVSTYLGYTGWFNTQFVGGGFVNSDEQIAVGTIVAFNHDTDRGRTQVTVIEVLGEKGIAPVKQAAYDGIIVRTRRVPAGEGLSDSVEKNEIAFVTKTPILANDEGHAKQLVAAAAQKEDATLDLADAIAPLTIIVRKF